MKREVFFGICALSCFAASLASRMLNGPEGFTQGIVLAGFVHFTLAVATGLIEEYRAYKARIKAIDEHFEMIKKRDEEFFAQLKKELEEKLKGNDL